MTWNYRIIHQTLGTDDWYAVHEVFYDQTGRITDWTACAVAPAGETLEELQESFALYQQAFSRPVLEWAELETGTTPRPADALDALRLDHATERMHAATCEAWAELLTKREKEILMLTALLEQKS